MVLQTVSAINTWSFNNLILFTIQNLLNVFLFHFGITVGIPLTVIQKSEKMACRKKNKKTY